MRRIAYFRAFFFSVASVLFFRGGSVLFLILCEGCVLGGFYSGRPSVRFNLLSHVKRLPQNTTAAVMFVRGLDAASGYPPHTSITSTLSASSIFCYNRF